MGVPAKLRCGNTGVRLLVLGVPDTYTHVHTHTFTHIHTYAHTHLGRLSYAGHEDKALARLEEYLTWVVENGRQSCAGCQQKRNEQAPMLTCNGCRVVRFCDADHQKMASKNIMAGGNLWQGRHKDICGLLGKWRGVVKNGVSRESLQEDLLAFLRQ